MQKDTTACGAKCGAQASYLKTLCEEVGETFNPNLTKAGASKMIDELRKRARASPNPNGQ